MLREWQRYVTSGEPVDIIYLDEFGSITQRRVKPQALKGEAVIAFCFTRRAIRTFLFRNILAVTRVRSEKGA